MNASTSNVVIAGAAVSLVAALAGCATSTPLSQLDDGQVYYRAHLNRYPVVVNAIDGKGNLVRDPQIDPGQHNVSFTTRPVAGFSGSIEKTYAMRIEPCTRYYVAADRATSLSQDWTLVVEKSEPVGGCNAAQEWRKSGQAVAQAAPAQGAIVGEVSKTN